MLPVRFSFQGKELKGIHAIDYKMDVVFPGEIPPLDGFQSRYDIAYRINIPYQRPELGYFKRRNERWDKVKLVNYTDQPVTPINRLKKEIKPTRRSLSQRVRHRFDKWRYPVQQIDQFDERADRLWERCKSDFGLAIVRDARYLNWRYVDCPDVSYLKIGVFSPSGAELNGWAVLRLDGIHPQTACLVDWLVPNAETGIAEILRRNVEHSTRLGGAQFLEVCFPEGSVPDRLFRAHGYQPAPAPATLMVHVFNPDRVATDTLQKTWYYTLGDSEMY